MGCCFSKSNSGMKRHDMPILIQRRRGRHMLAGNDSRAQAILEEASRQREELDASTKKKRFQFKRHTKMPFRLRLALFAFVFALMLMFYLLDFFAGGNMGIALNDWTDSMMDSAIHGICATAADITGSDWSGRELALSRLLLLGPVSYVVFSFFVSLVIAGIAALIWRYYATKHARDDGTSNFLPEPVAKRR